MFQHIHSLSQTPYSFYSRQFDASLLYKTNPTPNNTKRAIFSGPGARHNLQKILVQGHDNRWFKIALKANDLLDFYIEGSRWNPTTYLALSLSIQIHDAEVYDGADVNHRINHLDIILWLCIRWSGT